MINCTKLVTIEQQAQRHWGLGDVRAKAPPTFSINILKTKYEIKREQTVDYCLILFDLFNNLLRYISIIFLLFASIQ